MNSKSKEEAEKIAKEARQSISDYCINECHAYCCRKGYLILSDEEVDLLITKNKDELIKEESLKKQPDGKTSFNLGNSFGSCPRLVDNKCTVHKDPKRPSTCDKFPVFVREDSIRLSPRCFAVKTGMMYPFVHKFKELGFKIE